MEINRLLNDEITYELYIRGLPITGTVSEKRLALRNALRVERTGVVEPPSTVALDVISELRVCEDKLCDLEEDINNFNESNAVNENKRISSRLIHIYFRLERLVCDDTMEGKRNILIVICKNLTETLKNKFQPRTSHIDEPIPQDPNISVMDEPLLLLPEIDQLSSNQRDEGNLTDIDDCRMNTPHEDQRIGRTAAQSTSNVANRTSYKEQMVSEKSQQERRDVHTHNSVRFHEPQRNFQQCEGYESDLNRRRHSQEFGNRENFTCNSTTQFSPNYLPANYDRCDVHRWGLKYDGNSSLSTFLERLEELRQSRGITKQRLLQSSVELFEKDALLWYRMNEFSSWDDLIRKLREAFQPYDYENALWDEIRRRTQGSQERVIGYVSVMEGLFRKLPTKPTEHERVKIIRRNMLPYIQSQMALQSTYTLNDLIRIARTIEETEFRVQKFCPPPTNSKNLVEPELGYKKQTNHGNAAPVFTERQTEEQSRRNDLQKLCWNCGETTHKFRKCDKARKLFCFKCGKSDVTSYKCPECSKNAKAGQ